MAITVSQNLTQTTYTNIAVSISGLKSSNKYSISIGIHDSTKDFVHVAKVYTVSGSTSKTYVFDGLDDTDESAYNSMYNDSSFLLVNYEFTPAKTYGGIVIIVNTTTSSIEYASTSLSFSTKIPVINDSEPDFSNVTISEYSSYTSYTQIGYKISGLDKNYLDYEGWKIGVIFDSDDGYINEEVSAESGVSSVIFKKTGLNDATEYCVYLDYIKYYIDSEEYIHYFYENYVYITTLDNKDDYYPNFHDVYLSTTATSSTISVALSELDKNYNAVYGYRIQYRLYDGRPDDADSNLLDYTGWINVDSGITITPYHTFTGLESNTRYYVAARFSYQEYGEVKYFPNDYWEDYGADFGVWDFWQYETTTTLELPSASDLTIAQLTSSNQYSRIKLQVIDIPATPEAGWKFVWTINDEDGNTVATHTDTVYSYDDISAGFSFDGKTTAWEFSATQGVNYYAEIVVSYAPYDEVSGDVWHELEDILEGGPYTTVLNDDGGGMNNASLSCSSTNSSITASLIGLDTSYSKRTRRITWEIWDPNGNLVETSSASLSAYIYATEKVFDGLTDNTRYTITATVTYYLNDGTLAENPKVFSVRYSTSIKESYDYSRLSLSVSSTTQNSATLRLSGIDTSYPRADRTVYWSSDGVNWETSTLSAGVSYTTYTISSLSGATKYTFYAYIRFQENGSYYYTDPPVTVDGTTAVPSLTLDLTATSTTITAVLSEFDTNYSQGGRTAEWRIRKSSASVYTVVETTTIPDKISNVSYVFTGLSPATKYYIQVYIKFNTGSKTLSGNITTTLRPEKFQWTSIVEKDYEWRQHSNGGYYGITAAEWERLLDNINDVRTYFSLSEYPSITLTKAQSQSYPQGFTYPSSGDEFLAIYFNQALSAIAGIYSEKKGISGIYNDNYVISKKTSITAECLNNLVTLLNNLE